MGIRGRTQIPDMNGGQSVSSEPAGPIAIFNPKKTVLWVALIIVIGVYLFFIFGVILPVLGTGDYSSVWPESDKRVGAKIAIFYIALFSIIFSPGWIPSFRKGVAFFYSDRIEVEHFLGGARSVISYTEMVVTVHGNYRMVIYRCNELCRNSMFKKILARYLEGMSFGIKPAKEMNKEEVAKIMSVLEQNAAEFKRKSLS